MNRYPLAFTLAILVILALPLHAAAQVQVQVPPPERICDTQFEDCREPILNLIRNEPLGIDVAFWYMQDARFSNELVTRFKAGVPVRVIVDTRANATYPNNATILKQLSDAGIPMREKFGEDVLHWKMMLFHGQNIVHFSKANFDSFAYVPNQPNSDFEDEAVFFTNDDALTNSFRQRFEDRWTDTTVFRNYANITGPPARRYPPFPIDPSMNFPPTEDFSARAISRLDREMNGIDTMVFRVTEDRWVDAVFRAIARNVPVRIITEPQEYRNPKRLYDSKQVDRMFMGGAQIKIRQHLGLAHEASIVLRGLGEVIFGSSNWTLASALYQDEHNYFYNPTLGKPWFFQWFADQFTRKWNDTTNYVPFQPLPPDAPIYSSPGNGASDVGASATLTWEGGPWSHFYDVYFGTIADPPLVAGNVQIGAPDPGVVETYAVTNLQPGTTYYWRIVDRTWAQAIKTGPVWSFTTAGGGGGGSTPFDGTPIAIPGTIQAENFDQGGQFVAYFDTTPGNKGGVYRLTDVDIQATSDLDGAYNVGWTKPSEWLKYTVNVATTGTYQLETRVAQTGTGSTFHVEVDGVDKTGPIAVPDTGGWQTWRTITTAGIPLTAGVRVLRVVFDTANASGGGNYNWFRLSGNGPPPPPPPSLAWGGTPAPLPGIVQAENFDTGGEGVSYHDTSAGNSGGAYRSTDVDIATTQDPSSTGFFLGWTRVGEWVNYTVNVTQTRTYAVSVRVANLGAGAQLRIDVDGVAATGLLSLPNTGAWDAWQTFSLGTVALSQGQHVVRLVMATRNVENNGVGNYGFLSFQ